MYAVIRCVRVCFCGCKASAWMNGCIIFSVRESVSALKVFVFVFWWKRVVRWRVKEIRRTVFSQSSTYICLKILLQERAGFFHWSHAFAGVFFFFFFSTHESILDGESRTGKKKPSGTNQHLMLEAQSKIWRDFSSCRTSFIGTFMCVLVCIYGVVEYRVSHISQLPFPFVYLEIIFVNMTKSVK